MATVSTPLGATDLDRLVPEFKGRHSIFIATTTRSFRPSDFRETPAEITGCRRVAERVPMNIAQRFARLFNEQQIDRGVPDRLWVIIVRRPRVSHSQPLPGMQERLSALAALADNGGAA